MDRETSQMLDRVENHLVQVFRRLNLLESAQKQPIRIADPEIGMSEASARAQASQESVPSNFEFPKTSLRKWYENSLYQEPKPFVSRRSDTDAILTMSAFIRRLIDREDLAHAVTDEVRAAARKALDLPKL